MEQTKRTTYLDAIRIIAGLFVVYNHIAGQSMRLFDGASGAAALFLFYISKSAIPLFLMVSGALLLAREETYGRTLRRIGRIVLALALATLFYYGAACISSDAPFRLGAYCEALYHNGASNSLWYLYAYIGLLTMLPILQRMTPALGRREYLYFAFWTLLFNGLMPVLQFISPLFIYDSSFVLSLFSGVIGMAVLGRFLDGEERMPKACTAPAVLLPLGITAATVVWTMRDPACFSMLDNALLLPAMICALGIFYIVKRLDARMRLSERARGFISHVGKLVFCTYLIADFVIERLQFIREAMVPVLRVNGAGIAYTAIVFIVCLLLSELLTRIPLLKRVL